MSQSTPDPNGDLPAAASSQRERQRARTRERLFEAAVAEFRRVGFAAAQIPAIASAAGVVRGTFYFHFPSKDHVLLELVERNQAQLAAELRKLRGSGAPVSDVLARLVENVAQPEESSESNLIRDILAMYLRGPLDSEAESEPARIQSRTAVLEEVTFLFEEAALRGELRRDAEPEQLASMVLTSIFGLIVARGTTEDDGRELPLELLIDLLMGGLVGGS
jgi:AcrR family transcriptional regulator